MKILGISNPYFLGVTTATKAICTDWMPAEHMTVPYQWQHLASRVFHYSPDVLVIGGWSNGYMQLLTDIRRAGNKDFPVVVVSHSTPFHGSYFHEDWVHPEFEQAFEGGLADIMGFVHPATAKYYQNARQTFALFLPHAFKPQAVRHPDDDVFRIGILGGEKHWYKNVQGAHLVARDFAKRFKNVEIIAAAAYDKPQEAFLATVGYCSVLIHVSHLECYSNTIQEAWARGIPVITSPASDGLTIDNPLLSEQGKTVASDLRLSCGIDPDQLFTALRLAREHRKHYSDQVFLLSHELYERTHIYNRAIFQSLIDGYKDREHDVGLFESPFTSGGIEWDKLKGK